MQFLSFVIHLVVVVFLGDGPRHGLSTLNCPVEKDRKDHRGGFRRCARKFLESFVCHRAEMIAAAVLS